MNVNNMSHVCTLEAVIHQVRVPFRPKHDPSRNLAEEIESCKRKIWECIDLAERKQYFEKKQKKINENNGKIESGKENSKHSTNFVSSKPVKTVKVVQKPGEAKKQPPLTQVVQKLEEPKNQPPLTQVVQKPGNAKNQPPLTQVIEKPEEDRNPPPLVRTDVELKVFVMKVAELKKELKSRGKDTTGLKKDLRARLINVILEQADREQKRTFPVDNKRTSTSGPETIEESKEEQNKNSVSMEISEITEDEDEVVDKKESPSPPKDSDDRQQVDQKKESISSMQVEYQNETSETLKERKHRLEEVNENDLTGKDYSEKRHEECRNVSNSCPKESLIKTESSLAPINEMVVTSPSEQNECPPNSQAKKPEILTETKMREFSESQNENCVKEDVLAATSEVSFSSKASGTSVKDMVSKFSGFSTNPSSNNGSALSKGLQAKKEARQAKIAEMRAKAQSKPVSSTKVALTSKEYSSTLLSLNATASTASATKKNLATQMREKAAARAFQNKITNTASKTTTAPMTASTSKRHLPLTNNSNHSNTDVSDPLGMTLKQAPLIKKPSKVMSPMDTYEISDREDSDTDDSDSDSDNEKMKKKVPIWAQRSNLYSALEEQYNGRIGGKKVDPDEIFPEVHSCDLEAIFGRRKSKNYRSRQSSGNWANDKVTVAEKLDYKREMGFATEADSTNI